MRGAWHPASSILFLISGTAAAASGVLTVTRTISEPASASSTHCRAVAAASAVSVIVMLWTTTGAPPPTWTWPTRTGTVRCRRRGEGIRTIIMGSTGSTGLPRRSRAAAKAGSAGLPATAAILESERVGVDIWREVLVMRAFRLLLSLVVLLGFSAMLRAQAPVTSADLTKLETTADDIAKKADGLKTIDPTLSAGIAKKLADLRDDITYLKVKMRRGETVSRDEYTAAARQARHAADQASASDGHGAAGARTNRGRGARRDADGRASADAAQFRHREDRAALRGDDDPRLEDWRRAPDSRRHGRARVRELRQPRGEASIGAAT